MADGRIKSTNPKTDGYKGDKVLDDFEDEQIAVRGIEVEGDSRKFILKAKDPHGLWEIVPRKGSQPDALKGVWTSQWDAEQAIIRYCAANPVKEKYYTGDRKVSPLPEEK